MNISIITVCYNSSKTIEDTIISVINQTYYNNVQYIIIDGGSKDGTLDIISKYKDKIHVIVSEKDYGIYHAMNKGIKLATSEIIGILNSDDIFQDNNVLNDVAFCFKSDLDLDILYGNLVYVKSDNIDSVVRFWESSDFYNSYFEHGNVPPHPTLFLRARVYQIAGYFNLDYKLASDYEFMLRIFKTHKFKSKYVNRLLIRMRLGGATNKSISNILLANIEIYKSWYNNNFTIPFYFFPIRLYKKIKQFL